VPETEAFEATLTHHRGLEENVGILVAALTSVAAGSAHEAATIELAAYLADKVLPHALAEEQTIYRVAGTRAGLAGTVTEMIGEHRSIAFAIEQLANIATESEAARQAESIAALFAAHVAKEVDLLLPPLLADAQIDLAQLLVQMQRLTESAREAPFTEDELAPGPEAVAKVDHRSGSAGVDVVVTMSSGRHDPTEPRRAFAAVAIPSGYPLEYRHGGTKVAVQSLGGNYTTQACRGR
jgi:hypothetical protein